MQIRIEINDDDLLKLLSKLTGNNVVKAEQPKQEVAQQAEKERDLNDLNKVRVLNKVDTEEEKADAEKLMNECRDIVKEFVKNKKRKVVLDIFDKIGIKAIGNANNSQLLQFKELIANEKAE